MAWLNTPEWGDARRYWHAFWSGERLDRPVMLIHVPNPAHDVPEPEPADARTRHSDPEFILALNEAVLPRCSYFGETLPVSRTLMSAWGPTYGIGVDYHEDTVWIRQGLRDWSDAPDWDAAWDDAGWRDLKRAFARICEGAGGRYFVGLPPLLAPNDVLSMFRGMENFMRDLVAEPEQVKTALTAMRRYHVQMWNELDAMRDPSSGYGCWWPIWCPDRLRIVQSDMSCMISPAMFEHFVIPELEELSEDVDHLFYHLDGPDAVRHLDMICSVPKIRAIQWVPGAGNVGHGLHWMDLYKKVQSLGRVIWVCCAKQDLETVIRELDPRLLLLSVGAESEAEAQELKRRATAWTTCYWGTR